MTNFHVLQQNLQCTRCHLKNFLKILFLKTNICIVLPLIDKGSRFKQIYRICLCILKDFITNDHTNPNNLTLIVIPIIGKLKINNVSLKMFFLNKFSYNLPIKIQSKFNISFFILKRNLS